MNSTVFCLHFTNKFVAFCSFSTTRWGFFVKGCIGHIRFVLFNFEILSV